MLLMSPSWTPSTHSILFSSYRNTNGKTELLITNLDPLMDPGSFLNLLMNILSINTLKKKKMSAYCGGISDSL